MKVLVFEACIVPVTDPSKTASLGLPSPFGSLQMATVTGVPSIGCGKLDNPQAICQLISWHGNDSELVKPERLEVLHPITKTDGIFCDSVVIFVICRQMQIMERIITRTSRRRG